MKVLHQNQTCQYKCMFSLTDTEIQIHLNICVYIYEYTYIYQYVYHLTLLDAQASLAQSLVGTLLLSPSSWCTQDFVGALQESVSLVLWKFCNQILQPSKSKSLNVLIIFARSPGWEICCGSQNFLNSARTSWV